MTSDSAWHESFMVRMWAEPNGDERVLRGAIQNVQTGRTIYFDSAELPAELLRATVERLDDARDRAAN